MTEFQGVEGSDTQQSEVRGDLLSEDERLFDSYRSGLVDGVMCAMVLAQSQADERIFVKKTGAEIIRMAEAFRAGGALSLTVGELRSLDALLAREAMRVRGGVVAVLRRLATDLKTIKRKDERPSWFIEAVLRLVENKT